MGFLQLDEDLQRARCILVDGDASSFLPGNAQGDLFDLIDLLILLIFLWEVSRILFVSVVFIVIIVCMM